MIYCYYKHKGSDNMNVRDEANSIYEQVQKELREKEERKLARRTKIKNHPAYVFVSNIHSEVVDALDYWKLRRYDAKTKRIIKKIPKDMIKGATRGYHGMQVYTYYNQGLFGIMLLRDDMARYYLDRRGKHITEYLEKEGIRYELKTYSSTISAHYGINVYFKEGN